MGSSSPGRAAARPSCGRDGALRTAGRDNARAARCVPRAHGRGAVAVRDPIRGVTLPAGARQRPVLHAEGCDVIQAGPSQQAVCAVCGAALGGVRWRDVGTCAERIEGPRRTYPRIWLTAAVHTEHVMDSCIISSFLAVG